MVAAVYGAFWALDEAIEKWNPFDCKAWWDAHTTHLPVHWQEWLIGLLVLLILGLIDGSYRNQKRTLEKVNTGHAAELKKLGDQAAAAESEVARLSEKPNIKGEILAVFWEFYKDVSEIPWPKHSRYYIKLRLTNQNDVPCTIDRYSVAVENYSDDKKGSGQGAPSFAGKLYHPTYNYSDEGTEHVEERDCTITTWTRTRPIDISPQWPLEKGCKHEGWLTFAVWNFIPEPIKPDDIAPETHIAHWQQCVSVHVVDSLGNTHATTNILTDIAPARYERG